MVEEKKLKKNLADNLIRLRNERGLTQEALVNDLKKQDVDISRTALASYENQRSYPKLDVLFVLSRYFNKNIEDLLKDSGDKRNDFDCGGVAKLDLDDLLADFSEILMNFKMYRSMYFSLSEKILNEANSKEEREKWLKTITSVYASEQMKLPVLQEEYQQKLEPLELVVFQSIQNGSPILEIAQQLNIEPSDVTTLFISAKDKIFVLLLN